MFRWARWARCLPWKLHDWRARMSIGKDSWSYLRLLGHWLSTRMAPTIQRISTMVYCWDSRERWRKRSCTFYARASWAVNSIKRRKGNCDFHSPLDSVTTRMVILSLTPTKKCAAPYPWYFARFEKQAVPLPWYRTSPSVHCVFPSAPTAELGTASWYGVVLLTRVCCVCSRTHLMPACMSLVATSIINKSARPARFRKNACGPHARLARPTETASRRIHQLGRIPGKWQALGKEPHEWGSNDAERPGSRRLGFA